MISAYMISMSAVTALSFIVTVIVGIAFYMKSKKVSHDGRRMLIFLLASLAEWALFYSCECLTTDIATKLIYIRLQYIGIACTPIAFAFLTKVNYLRKPLSRYDYILGGLAGVYMVAAMWFNPFNLFYKNIYVDTTSTSAGILVIDRGILFYINQVIIFIAFLLAGYRIYRALKQQSVLKRQILLIIMSIAIPVSVNILFTYSITASDWTPASFIITSNLLYACFNNYGLFDSKTYIKRNILNLTDDYVFMIGVEGTVDYANPAAQRLLGLDTGEILGKKLEELLPGIDADYHDKAEFEQYITINDHEPIYMHFRAVHLSGNQELKSIMMIARNKTDIHTIERRLDYLRGHDEATGLYNASKFIEIMQDYQKAHDEGLGGTLLCAGGIRNIGMLSSVLSTEQRKNFEIIASDYINKNIIPGTVLARFGENVFYVFSNGVPINLHEFKELLSQTSKTVITLGSQAFSLDFRIGVYVVERGADINTAIANTAYALNAALADESDPVRVYDRSLKLQHDLYKYLFETSEVINYEKEFVVEYQPIIDVSKNKVIGAEALVRWNHPTLGRIFPRNFIPVFENSGNMWRLGDYVLRTAINTLKRWQELYGEDFFVSVNLSKSQFDDRGFVERLKNMLDEAKIAPKSLCLEINENHVFGSVNKAINFSEKVRELGVLISLDGFSWGNSSIAHIVKLKCNKVKLEVDMMSDTQTDSDTKMIMNGFLQMCNKIGVSLVVQRVEMIGDMQAMKEMHYPYVQGNIFSDALTAAAFESFHSTFDVTAHDIHSPDTVVHA